MPNASQMVYLSEEQYVELVEEGTITVEGVTVNYNENDIYVTPQDKPITGVEMNSTSIVSGGVAEIPVGANTLGVVKVDSANSTYGLAINSNSGRVAVFPAPDSYVKEGYSLTTAPIVPANEHKAVFYGLAKAAGDTTQAQSSNMVGTYTAQAKTAILSMLGAQPAGSSSGVTDVQVDGTSIVSNNVATIPIAENNGDYGLIKIGSNSSGVVISNNQLYISRASDDNIRLANNLYRPITSTNQHRAVFFGLAAAAGDATQSADANSVVGTYTESAKSAIHEMLNAPVTVSGTTPSITAKAGICYKCGEVSTLTITPCASGTCEVQFTSGTTATVLTASGVTWPEWFDATSLETERIYDVLITDGTLGMVMSWPA